MLNSKLNPAQGRTASTLAKSPISRKNFLRFSGLTAITLAVGLQACDDDPMAMADIDLGTGDIGVLNYAFALEQLEAAFYIAVTSSFYAGITTEERNILNDLRDHEVAHRDFFAAAIPSASRIPALEFDFSAVNFKSRDSVLQTAKALEDTGVSAYNGAGYLIENVDYLLIAGKIVSVEARHASAIRDLLNPFSRDFAGDDIVTASNGLDMSAKPSAVIPIANSFLVTKIAAPGLA